MFILAFGRIPTCPSFEHEAEISQDATHISGLPQPMSDGALPQLLL